MEFISKRPIKFLLLMPEQQLVSWWSVGALERHWLLRKAEFCFGSPIQTSYWEKTMKVLHTEQIQQWCLIFSSLAVSPLCYSCFAFTLCIYWPLIDLGAEWTWMFAASCNHLPCFNDLISFITLCFVNEIIQQRETQTRSGNSSQTEKKCCVRWGDSLLSSLSQLSISMDVSMLLMADSEPPPPAAPGRSGDSRLLLPPPPPPTPPTVAEPWAPGLSAVGAATWLGESGSEKEDVGDRRGK